MENFGVIMCFFLFFALTHLQQYLLREAIKQQKTGEQGVIVILGTGIIAIPALAILEHFNFI